MNRYFVFAGERYYPSGGWNDFVNSFSSLEVAKEAALATKEDWAHVVDSETGRVVFSY